MSAAQLKLFSGAETMMQALGADDHVTAVTIMDEIELEFAAGRKPKLERTDFDNVYLRRELYDSFGFKDYEEKEELVVGFARGRSRTWWVLGAYCRLTVEDGTQLIQTHFAAQALEAKNQA